jgi:hypothetical protein
METPVTATGSTELDIWIVGIKERAFLKVRFQVIMRLFAFAQII